MHHFVFHSRLGHARSRRVLETAKHLHLRANSAVVKFQRLFATTIEEPIWLHRHIRVSHSRTLRFVSLNVNVLLTTSSGFAASLITTARDIEVTGQSSIEIVLILKSPKYLGSRRFHQPLIAKSHK